MRAMLAAFGLVFLTAALVSAEPGFDFQINADVQSLSGQTDYTMDIILYDPVSTDFLQLKSQLEFPLDVTMYGGTAELTLNPGMVNQIRLGVTVLKNGGDPGDKMTDSDWWNFRTGSLEKFSYTESDAEMSAVLVDATVGWTFLRGPVVSIAAVGGFRYQKIDQDINGFEGWQLDQNGSRINVSFPDSAALTYRITYKMPQFGFRGEVQPVPWWMATLDARWTPVLFDDVDDHLLRNREATGDGSGKGFIGSIDLSFNLPGGQARPFIALHGDIMRLKVNGDQTQYWYGDDPATPDFDDTGDRIAGIPHDVESTQYRIGGRVGVRF